jgi:chromosome segregation ATPase
MTAEERIERLESLMVELATINRMRAQMTDDHEERLTVLERLGITLGNIVERHEERMSDLTAIMAQNQEQMARHQEQMASLNASNERLDRIIDYLLRREGDLPPDNE